MNLRDKLNNTLNFKNCTADSGAVLETFFPWGLTVENFISEGLPSEYLKILDDMSENNPQSVTQYFDIKMTESIAEYESYFGFDKMYRMHFQPPFSCVHSYGEKPPVVCMSDWEKIKAEAEKTINKYHTDENIKKIYSAYSQGHKNGEFSIRFAIKGFFWLPRDLFGVEEHMIALYDEPEILHDINSYMCDYYIKYLDKIFDYIVPDVFYIMEDLSGANGPMISPAHFSEYLGFYYKKLIPFLKAKGVGHVFVDTDGDFNMLIPDFIECGVEGFLPMDFNAGMDIEKVREEYPRLKLIGAFNKLVIREGKESIDKEFERLLPVIKQGGYVPSCDHQAAPDSTLENYMYYAKKLREVMKHSGENL